MRRVIVLVAAALGLVHGGCFRGVDAPECRTLADCPQGAGYAACEDGYCFRAGAGCEGAVPRSGDGCCPAVEADRSQDTDCLALDVDLDGRDPAAPAVGPGGDLYVAYLGGAPGDTSVFVRRIDAQGVEAAPVRVGRGVRAVAPVISGNTLYVAFGDGVMRYQLPDVVDLDVIPSDPPTGGIAATGTVPNRRRAVAWPTASGRFVVYDETEMNRVGDLDLAAAGLGGGNAFPPVVTGNGRRVLVLWASGTLVALEAGTNPVGPVASVGVGTPVTGPVEADGVVYVATSDGQLAARTLKDAGFESRWSLDLGAVATGGLAVDPEGRVVVALRDGTVLAVRDAETRGTVAVQARLGASLADVYPALGTGGRVVALADDGGTVRTALLSATDGSAGLWFRLAVPAVTAPVLASGRLVLGTASGRLQAWRFPSDPAAGRFAGLGNDGAHTGRTSPGTTDRAGD